MLITLMLSIVGSNKRPLKKLNENTFNFHKSKDFGIGWLIGLIDAKACFCVSFNLKKSMPCGIETRPSFSISLHSSSPDSIESIRDYFRCDTKIRVLKNDMYKFEVRSIVDLTSTILPFIRTYGLYTKKREDFLLFDEICQMISSGQHLNSEGLKDILKKSYNMNGDEKRKYTLQELYRIIDESNNI